ncbi:hypothetical protein FRC07_011819 [Ceratobasidium sp. 392]|nr:hypothetical protein FRC07_011819 [Ceratobasidium sp. 392]
MRNLASAYRDQTQKYEQVKELLQEAIEAGEKTRGPEYNQTPKNKVSLADIYRHQKRWEEAEKLEWKAAEVKTRMLEHNRNFALACRSLAHLTEAGNLMGGTVSDSKVAFGARTGTQRTERDDL